MHFANVSQSSASENIVPRRFQTSGMLQLHRALPTLLKPLPRHSKPQLSRSTQSIAGVVNETWLEPSQLVSAEVSPVSRYVALRMRLV